MTSMHRLTLHAALLAAVVAVNACGVGNDDETAGSLTPFNIVPNASTFTGPNSTTCGTGTTRVFIFGGAGPYQIHNTSPELTVTPTTVNEPGQFFDVTAFDPTVCLTTASIVVVDKWGRQVVFNVTTSRGT
ncbi:MAG: hypothetical protein JNL30_01695 [Rubrivivax sp.]|nr:hypothetical protein [Rubrivivax sp.]